MDRIILTLAMVCFAISFLAFAAIVLFAFPWRLKETIAAMRVAATPERMDVAQTTTTKSETSENKDQPGIKAKSSSLIDLEEAVYHVMRTKQTLASFSLALAALMMICSTILIMSFRHPTDHGGDKPSVSDPIKPIAIDATLNLRVDATNVGKIVSVRSGSNTSTPTYLPEATSRTNRSVKP